MSIASIIDQTLESFTPVSLEDLKDVSMMNRMDLKYVFPVLELPAMLEDIQFDYRVLEVNGVRNQLYETIYFDTPGLEMYHMHHRGKLERHKVRFRMYPESERVFLEVKIKDNHGITEKNRVECDTPDTIVLSHEEEFLSTHTPYEQENLAPVLRNSFRRITLAKPDVKERITIDFNVKLHHISRDSDLKLPGLAIAEVKREGVVYGSSFTAMMKQHRVQPMRFSKYITGIAKLDPEVPSNRFKTVIRKVDNINYTFLEEIKKK